jgi:protein required for attachment to host cells
MNTVWVLVCDAARGRLFEVHEGHAPWNLVETFSHESSRERSSDLATDHVGSSSPKGASVHHNALAPSSTPKEVEQGHFVHTLKAALEQARQANRFKRWVLVAPPHFLGMLKKELTPELSHSLMATVDKDLSRHELPELAEHLRDAVSIAPDQRDVVRETVKHTH